MEDLDTYFMNEAIREAELAFAEGNWPIGCVIVLDEVIIARGRNEVFTKRNKLFHAEMRALEHAQDSLYTNPRMATLYSTYEPCPMCLGACMLSKIKRVVSGINVENSGAMHLRNNLPLLFTHEKYQIDFTHGVLAKECFSIFIKGKPIQKLIDRGTLDQTKVLHIQSDQI